MSKRMFTSSQLNKLVQNKHVLSCSPKSITYSPEFKLWAIKRYYDDGYPPQEIFREAGFDISVIGKDTPGSRLKAWRRTYREKGASKLRIETRGNSGRPRTKHMNNREKIEYLEAKIAYLKAENDFLAKLRAARKE